MKNLDLYKHVSELGLNKNVYFILLSKQIYNIIDILNKKVSGLLNIGLTIQEVKIINQKLKELGITIENDCVSLENENKI